MKLPLEHIINKKSAIVLIVTNVLILAVAIYFNWHAYDTMIAYWFESALIGLFAIPKMAMASGETEDDKVRTINGKMVEVKPIKTPIIIFCIVIFFVLWAIHGALIENYFHPGFSDMDGPLDSFAWVMRTNPEFWLVLALLIGSHIFAFYYNFINQKEFEKTTFTDELYKPFNTILKIHLIIWGICLVFNSIHDNYGILILIITVKTFIDLWLQKSKSQADKKTIS